MSKGAAKQISLGDDFGDLIIAVNHMQISVSADGRVVATPEGQSERASSETAVKSAPTLKPGDSMKDGSIFAGISPDTGRPLFTTIADARLSTIFGVAEVMDWDDAVDYAASFKMFGHDDWRLPTPGELNVLFNNRAAIGGFNSSGVDPGGWYWSASTRGSKQAWDQRFTDGRRSGNEKANLESVRCVRG